MTEPTDWRALCAELAYELQGYKVANPMHCRALLERARTALAQPEPEGATDEELYDLADVFNGDPVPAMRRALDLWGLPAIEPVTRDQWHEDDGAVLWWTFPVEEPPYVGSPLCDDWPGYHTHFTRLDVPADPHHALPVPTAQ